MSLADLIHGKNQSVGFATATLATVATDKGSEAGSVARVATVAVAKSESAKTELPTKADPAPLWWRVAITEPSGKVVEVDTPSGCTLADWQAYAVRYHGPGSTVTPITVLPKPSMPVPLAEALAAACEGVAGITVVQLRSLLSREDITDIEAGRYPIEDLRAYARSFVEGIRSGRITVLPGRTA